MSMTATTLRRRAAVMAALAGLTLATPVAAGALDEIRRRGELRCGVSEGLPGFSDRDAQGVWRGFDVDFCRAVAAAALGDATKVTFTPLSATARFESLRKGEIDLLSRNSTWTLEREASLGLLFAGITYHDGQGFMVLRRPSITSALELGGLKVCAQSGTTSQLNLADFFRANAMTYEERSFPSAAEAFAAFADGRCEVLTRDQSALYADRTRLPKPGDAVILPDVISKEPLSPVVRANDIAWFNVVKWVNFALINAEELGIMAGCVDEALASAKPDVRRFVGKEGGLGAKLGLDDARAIRAVKAVGNYGEILDRNVGALSPLGVPRGLNHLWTLGGVLYAPPLR